MNADPKNQNTPEPEVIDIEGYAKAGRPVPPGKKYKIRIDRDFYTVTMPKMTGRQILAEAGKTPEPEYTAKGLAKKDDKTGGTSKGYQYTFDAWDRLVTVKSNSGAVVEEFRYNGLGHRIGWHYDVDADLDVDGDDRWFSFQYNERWQQVAMYYHTNSSPREVFTYLAAGRDGYGGSSYIDDCLMRERDTNANGDLDERLYYLQNWRHDVVALMTYDGAVKERLTYDAYGRPHAFSPGDLITKISGTPYDRPSGTLDADDTWTTGSVVWNKDIGNGSGVAIPDGAVTSADGTTLTNLKAAGYSAGYGILSDAGVGNRKGYAGYEFDTILEGAASTDNKPVYHVRHRVLASDTGKWFQKDPLGYHDGMDLYEYCKSDAVDREDAMGLACGKKSCAAASPSVRIGSSAITTQTKSTERLSPIGAAKQPIQSYSGPPTYLYPDLPCFADTDYPLCDYFCDRTGPGGDSPGGTCPDYGKGRGVWLCCICTKNIRNSYCPDPLASCDDEGIEIITRCIAEHEEYHIHQTWGTPQCKECLAYILELGCLEKAEASCTSPSCREIVRKRRNHVLDNALDFCSRCDLLIPGLAPSMRPIPTWFPYIPDVRK